MDNQKRQFRLFVLTIILITLTILGGIVYYGIRSYRNDTKYAVLQIESVSRSVMKDNGLFGSPKFDDAEYFIIVANQTLYCVKVADVTVVEGDTAYDYIVVNKNDKVIEVHLR